MEKENIGNPGLNAKKEQDQLEELKQIRLKREEKERKALIESKTMKLCNCLKGMRELMFKGPKGSLLKAFRVNNTQNLSIKILSPDNESQYIVSGYLNSRSPNMNAFESIINYANKNGLFTWFNGVINDYNHISIGTNRYKHMKKKLHDK